MLARDGGEGLEERDAYAEESRDFADEIGKMLDMKYDSIKITPDNVESFRKLILFMQQNKDKIGKFPSLELDIESLMDPLYYDFRDYYDYDNKCLK